MKNTGFMYWDNRTNKTSNEKILECAGLYEKRYSKKPNQCFIHLDKSNDVERIEDGIRVIPLKNILIDHFWLGENII